MSQNNHALNPPKTPIFNVLLHRQPIAHGVNSRLAMRLKRRFPALIVKFQGFEGAV